MNNPWQSIEKPDADFNVKLVGNSHPLNLYWGRDTQGRYLFVYESSSGGVPDGKTLPKLSGISVILAPSSSRPKLVLILKDTSNWELFYTLCCDLVRATAHLSQDEIASVVFVRRLARWHEFWKRERSGLLSNESVKGLIGELLFLSCKLSSVFGWRDAVYFWKGPEDAPQDFAINNTAVEIKCQSGGTKPTVRINSAEQLCPQLPDGFLVVYTIASAECQDASGFTLNTLVSRIRVALQDEEEATRERFEDLLFLSGYITREEYDKDRFVQIAVKSYRLVEGFPRIDLTDIPPALERVSYSLKLEGCEAFLSTPDWWSDSYGHK